MTTEKKKIDYTTIKVQLTKIEEVIQFVTLANRCPHEVRVSTANDINASSICVDGKSLMGVFSLDLSTPVYVDIPTEDCPPELIGFLEKISRQNLSES